MKLPGRLIHILHGAVAPFAGAWIEIVYLSIIFKMPNVAPFAGAWIEISDGKPSANRSKVAPFAGAWIEIGW